MSHSFPSGPAVLPSLICCDELALQGETPLSQAGIQGGIVFTLDLMNHIRMWSVLMFVVTSLEYKPIGERKMSGCFLLQANHVLLSSLVGLKRSFLFRVSLHGSRPARCNEVFFVWFGITWVLWKERGCCGFCEVLQTLLARVLISLFRVDGSYDRFFLLRFVPREGFSPSMQALFLKIKLFFLFSQLGISQSDRSFFFFWIRPGNL